MLVYTEGNGGYYQIIHFRLGFPLMNHAAIGDTPSMETPGITLRHIDTVPRPRGRGPAKCGPAQSPATVGSQAMCALDPVAFSIVMGIPPRAGWFIIENHRKSHLQLDDDWGWHTPISGNLQIIINHPNLALQM